MSVSEATAAQVSVRVVPIALERTNVRMVALVPAESVRVPLMVWSAVRMIGAMPALVRPVTDRLLNVLACDIVLSEPAVLVKLTLLKACPPPENVVVAAVQVI